MDALTMLIVSTLTPFLLEKLKWAHWFPLMQPYAPWLNRLTPVALAGPLLTRATV